MVNNLSNLSFWPLPRGWISRPQNLDRHRVAIEGVQGVVRVNIHIRQVRIVFYEAKTLIVAMKSPSNRFLLNDRFELALVGHPNLLFPFELRQGLDDRGKLVGVVHVQCMGNPFRRIANPGILR